MAVNCEKEVDNGAEVVDEFYPHKRDGEGNRIPHKKKQNSSQTRGTESDLVL
jgi:hypothetical protein